LKIISLLPYRTGLQELQAIAVKKPGIVMRLPQSDNTRPDFSWLIAVKGESL